LRDFKVIAIYLKKLRIVKYRQFSLIPLSMVVGVCKQEQQRSARKRGDFYRQESSFKGRHRHFCGRYRTLFNINVRFK